MKDYFIIERENFMGAGPVFNKIRVMLINKSGPMFVDVDDVKFALDFAVCERDIPSFYK